MAALAADPLPAGDHRQKIEVDGRDRSFLVHVPPQYDPRTPTPVVLVFHGAGMSASSIIPFSGMNAKSDEAGFIAVYPNGTGLARFYTFNAGGRRGKMAEGSADDVKFVRALLDHLATIISVDSQRVFATGMSNGGMMCYRLAAELNDRIAAIAPIAGTLAVEVAELKRPVSVMHFHGTADAIVPMGGPADGNPRMLTFNSVADTISLWTRLDGCPSEGVTSEIPCREDDGTSVRQTRYGPGRDGTEVVLIEIEGGGHTWPGQKSPAKFIGKSTLNISANDLMWEFFQRHPLRPR